jgi:RNA polymerase sigma-70 factor (ECF subfamily)
MASKSVNNEKDLLQLALRWDKPALAEIYERFSPGLYRYSFRLLGDAMRAEECMAETFERFLQAVHGGGGPRQHLQAYLYRVAHNWITDYYRRQPPPSEELDPNLRSSSNPPQSTIEQMESERLRKALMSLTPDQRQAVSLKYLEGWPNKQISAALDKSVGAVKALQQRGLNSLKKSIQAELGRTK